VIIGVDAGCLSVSDKRLQVGVYQLSFNLLKSLSRVDITNEYLLYSFSPISEDILSHFGPHMENRVLKPRKFWLTARVSLEFLLRKPDIFLGLNQALPIFHPMKTIIFVYDLAFEHFPNCYLDSFNKLSWQTRYAVYHSDKIVAISYSTKNNLIKLYGIRGEKIEVNYPGVDSIFTPQSRMEINRIREKYGLKVPYFLFVGSLKPIKNIPRIIEGFYRFLKQMKTPYQLVLVGSDFWLDKEIPRRIKQLKLKKEVLNLGYLPREELPGIYSGAIAFISPSLYEGFGIPLLEAMACGMPIVTSNVGSMPEVVDNAALLVDPKDTDEISEAFIKIAKSRNLQDTLKKRGLERVKNFSWEKFAQTIFNLINSLK
jgi:glycosyltransferase involved in cell wall biosynthesis